jgi:hypothetical protein
MSPEDVAVRVDAIALFQEDPEVAHGMEDELYLDVLEAIASGAPEAGRLAQRALRARSLDFPRWDA